MKNAPHAKQPVLAVMIPNMTCHDVLHAISSVHMSQTETTWHVSLGRRITDKHQIAQIADTLALDWCTCESSHSRTINTAIKTEENCPVTHSVPL